MSSIFMIGILLGILAFVIFIIMGLISAIRKKTETKRNFIIAASSFVVVIVCFIGFGSTYKNSENDNQSTPSENSSSALTFTSKEEKKEQEDIEKKTEELRAKRSDKINYREDISFENLARTPDDYLNEMVKATGTVAQVIESGNETQLRVAINDDYDSMVLIDYTSSIISERLLENDTITFYGESDGLVSYEATSGADITIPSIKVFIIERQN